MREFVVPFNSELRSNENNLVRLSNDVIQNFTKRRIAFQIKYLLNRGCGMPMHCAIRIERRFPNTFVLVNDRHWLPEQH